MDGKTFCKYLEFLPQLGQLSARDILQRPNFKFAVYLGASAIARHSNAATGATVGKSRCSALAMPFIPAAWSYGEICVIICGSLQLCVKSKCYCWSYIRYNLSSMEIWFPSRNFQLGTLSRLGSFLGHMHCSILGKIYMRQRNCINVRSYYCRCWSERWRNENAWSEELESMKWGS